MNEKQEKQFETKFSTAVILFAQQFQYIMENSVDDLSESIVEKFKTNLNISIEEMTKEIVTHVVNELIKEYDLLVENYET
ncbi:hypothetical protein [Tissierella sp.]|uniref:hypothetical protein n=1 Tax=Tissierella sp. TaxID=41274 RepID=UPI0028660C8F|nr:hypothetical protein [Tissierella sp.]MDR7856094.1 hypothetical protein [Tissierella sp.]